MSIDDKTKLSTDRWKSIQKSVTTENNIVKIIKNKIISYILLPRPVEWRQCDVPIQRRLISLLTDSFSIGVVHFCFYKSEQSQKDSERLQDSKWSVIATFLGLTSK